MIPKGVNRHTPGSLPPRFGCKHISVTSCHRTVTNNIISCFMAPLTARNCILSSNHSFGSSSAGYTLSPSPRFTAPVTISLHTCGRGWGGLWKLRQTQKKHGANCFSLLAINGSAFSLSLLFYLTKRHESHCQRRPVSV